MRSEIKLDLLNQQEVCMTGEGGHGEGNGQEH